MESKISLKEVKGIRNNSQAIKDKKKRKLETRYQNICNEIKQKAKAGKDGMWVNRIPEYDLRCRLEADGFSLHNENGLHWIYWRS